MYTFSRSDSASPRWTAVLLGFLVATLFAQQMVALPAMKIAAAARGLPGSPASLLRLLAATHRFDWIVLLVLPVVPTALLAVLEFRNHGIRRLLGPLLDRPGTAALLLAGIVMVLGRFFIEPGLPFQFDAKLHFMEAAETFSLLRRGAAPLYSFTYYGGFPFLHFQGPLFYVLAALLTPALGTVSAAVKCELFILYVAGALATFRLVRILGGSPRAAFFGGLAVSVSFLHIREVALAGRTTVSLLYVWFPLLLAEAEVLSRSLSVSSALRCGALSALLLLSHPGLAPYAIGATAIYILVRSLSLDQPLYRLRRILVLSLPTALATVSLSAGLLTSALTEGKLVQVTRMYGSTGASLAFLPDLHHLLALVRWTSRFGKGSVSYVGISILGLLLVQFVRPGGKKRLVPALLVTSLVLLWLTGGDYLPSRASHFFVVLAAAAGALCLDRFGSRFFAVALVLLAVDLGFGTIQSPLRPDLGYDVNYVRAAVRRTGGERCLRVSERKGRFALSQWASNYDSGLPLLTGPFREASPAAYPLILDLLKRLARDLDSGHTLRPSTRLGLRVFGVHYLLCEDGSRPRTLDVEGLKPIDSPPLTEVPGAGPLVAVLPDVAATGWLRRGPEERWDAVLKTAPPEITEPRRSGVTVSDFSFSPDRIEIGFTAARSGLLLTSFQTYPGLVARLDGVVTATRQTPVGMAALSVSSGPHHLILTWSPPRPLAIAWMVSLLAAAVACLLLIRSAFVRRR